MTQQTETETTDQKTQEETEATVKKVQEEAQAAKTLALTTEANTAKEKAEQNNIIAISLDEANKHEWSDFIEKIVIGLYRFEVSLLDAGAQLKRQSNEVLADNETLYDKSGKEIGRAHV